MITISLDPELAIALITGLIGVFGWFARSIGKLASSIVLLNENIAVSKKDMQRLEEKQNDADTERALLFLKIDELEKGMAKIEGKCEVHHG